MNQDQTYWWPIVIIGKMLSDDTGRFLSFDTEYIMMSLSANKAQEITSLHFFGRWYGKSSTEKWGVY